MLVPRNNQPTRGKLASVAAEASLLIATVIAANTYHSSDAALPLPLTPPEHASNLLPNLHTIGSEILRLYQKTPRQRRGHDDAGTLFVTINNGATTLILSEVVGTKSAPNGHSFSKVDITKKGSDILSMSAYSSADGKIYASCSDSHGQRAVNDQREIMTELPTKSDGDIINPERANMMAANILNGIGDFAEAATAGQAEKLLSSPNIGNECSAIS